MKKFILYILLISGILLINGCSSSFYLTNEPSCGDEYNSAFKSALEIKDVSFCWNKAYIPQTIQWDNGVIVENICKNYDGERISIDDETCVETFVIYNNQPQLCTLFDKSLY